MHPYDPMRFHGIVVWLNAEQRRAADGTTTAHLGTGLRGWMNASDQGDPPLS